MLAHLADVSIRSLLLALPAAIVLWLMRRRRTAALQHAVWTAVVCGMLALFAFGQVLPRLPLRIPDRPAASVQTTSVTSIADQPMLGDAVPVSARALPVHPFNWIALVFYIYFAVTFGFLTQFAIGMFLVRKLLRSARPVQRGVYESEILTIPVTVGCL